MKGIRLCAAALFAVFASFFTAEAAADASEPITVVLVASTDPADAANAVVSVTITNTGDQPVTLSQYRLPFDWPNGLPNALFNVTDEFGTPQRFTAGYQEGGEALPSTLTVLQPHQSLSGNVSLAKSYRFDTQVTNRFKVSFTLPLGIVAEGDAPDENSPGYATNPNRRRFVTSNEVTIVIVYPHGRAQLSDPSQWPLSDVESYAGYPDTVLLASPIKDPTGSCTAVGADGQTVDRSQAIIDAFEDAHVAAGAAIEYAGKMFGTGGYNPAAKASIDWVSFFGPYDGGQYMIPANGHYVGRFGQTIARYRGLLYDTQTHKPENRYGPSITCGCPSGTRPETKEIAYPYYTIALCDSFFDMAAKGLQSRALTLLHSLTHYDIAVADGNGQLMVRATADYAYTTSWDQALAKESPAQAINNADSYEKFAYKGLQDSKVSGW